MLYVVDKLINETRRVAIDYHALTGQVLPVSNEIARYDVAQILKFKQPKQPQSGVDLVGTIAPWQDWLIQVKSRVIFSNSKQRSRIGQLNFDAPWQAVILDIMNDKYEPVAFYLSTREELNKILNVGSIKNKRGALSVAKFQAIAKIIWKNDALY